MSIIFMRAITDSGPRTIVFAAGEAQARLWAETATYDAITILPPRPAYASVAQIVAMRTKLLDAELARIKRRKERRAASSPDASNITRIYPAKGQRHGRNGAIRDKRQT